MTRCFINGRIHTIDPKHPSAEAIVVTGDRISFVGQNDDARVHAGNRAEVVDLRGATMLPGFCDDHTHLIGGGRHLQGIDLRPSRSKEEFSLTIRDYATSHRGAWITDGDWDHEAWSPVVLPRRDWIDDVTAETPVFVQRFDGHMALANSVALRLAGINAATPDPEGGTIDRDPATGEPTGIVRDLAMNLVAAVVPRLTPQEIERAALTALDHARKKGLTSVHDISLPEHYEAYEKLDRENRLTCRVYCRLPLETHAALTEQGIRHGHGTDFLVRGSMKAFSDGSLGSDTAWFFEPYVSNPATCGLPMEVLTSGKLRAWALEADRNRLQLSIHAIGDRANDAVLGIFEEIVRVNPPWDRRFRIEHAQHVRAQDISRFARLGVIVSAQPYHAVDDGVWAAKRIGEERCARAYVFRDFLNAGVRVCFGSDWTVAPLDPLLGIAAAVTRQTLDGKNPGGWYPAQKLTVDEAVTCYTLNNAYAEFREHDKGSIEKGKLADLVVLGGDPWDVSPEKIAGLEVLRTIVGGTDAWCA